MEYPSDTGNLSGDILDRSFAGRKKTEKIEYQRTDERRKSK